MSTGSPMVTTVQYYNGSHLTASNLQKTVDMQYAVSAQNSFAYIDNFQMPYSIIPILTKTTLPNGVVSQTCLLHDSMQNGPCAGSYNSGGGPTFYDKNDTTTGTTYPFSYGSTVQKSEYDYGSGAAGALLRQTNTQVQWQANGSYLTANLLNLPASVAVLDGGAHQVAQTTFGYDENNGSPQGIFGNQTSVTRWLNVGASPKTQTIYNTQGMPIKAIDPMGNTTQITYDGTGMFPNQIQYPTTANGVAHIEKFVYDANIGKMTSHTNENSQVSSFG